MAIQILVMTDEASTLQGVISAMEDRRARVLVHPCDASLLIAAREASPSAVLLDVSQGSERASAVRDAMKQDSAFEGVPVFALGGELAEVTSYYDDLSGASSVAAEILAIAELTFGFQGGDDAGLFDSLDQEMDLASTLGPPPKAASRSNSGVARPPGPPSPPPRPPGPPPRRPAAAAAAGDASSEVAALKQSLASRDEELEALRAKITELESQVEASAAATADDAASSEELARVAQELERQAGEHEAKVETLNATIATQDEAAEASAARIAELEAQVAAAAEDNAVEALAEERDALAAQRDEAIALAEDLEAALSESVAQAEALGARLEHADQLIEALRTDLGVYVTAAHRAEESKSEQRELLAQLMESFAGAQRSLEASVNGAAPETLAATTWEEAYNAYRAANAAPSDDEADAEDADEEASDDAAADA